MANPYIVGRPVPYSQLYGRDQLIQTCCNDIHNSIWLLGRRRSGKTSVLLAVEELILKEGEWFPVYISFEHCYSDDDIREEFSYRLEENLNESKLKQSYQPSETECNFIDCVRDFCSWLNIELRECFGG
jgi:predicted AAA+ superfamily ATPase